MIVQMLSPPVMEYNFYQKSEQRRTSLVLEYGKYILSRFAFNAFGVLAYVLTKDIVLTII